MTRIGELCKQQQFVRHGEVGGRLQEEAVPARTRAWAWARARAGGAAIGTRLTPADWSESRWCGDGWSDRRDKAPDDTKKSGKQCPGLLRNTAPRRHVLAMATSFSGRVAQGTILANSAHSAGLRSNNYQSTFFTSGGRPRLRYCTR